MKFDAIDKKLISYLYHNYREPLTKIGKACRISRDQTEYRLKKYEKQGIIKKYATVFNYDLLGYKEFIIIWLNLKATNEKKKTLKKEIENMKNIISTGDVLANYDMFVNFIFKDKAEFEKIFYSFVEKHKAIIKNYSVFITTYIEFFPLKEFSISSEEKTYSIVGSSKSIELNEKDLKILKALEKNGRARIVDIAEEVGISSELVLYQLKQFHKNKIILGTRIIFDMEKLGFYFGSINIKLKNLNEELKERIKHFCKNHKYINLLSFGIGEYNCLVQFFYKEEKIFRKGVRNFLQTFEKGIESSQILLVEDEGKVRTLSL